MPNNHGGARPGAGRPRKTSEFAYPEFTSAQIKKLSSSPYVYNITKVSISFTKSFKDLFWQRYCDGIIPSQIFDDAELPSKTISSERIYAFVKSLKAQVANNQLFVDGNNNIIVSERLFKPQSLPRRANASKILDLNENEIAKPLN